jgi:hypothetical protein
MALITVMAKKLLQTGFNPCYLLRHHHFLLPISHPLTGMASAYAVNVAYLVVTEMANALRNGDQVPLALALYVTGKLNSPQL